MFVKNQFCLLKNSKQNVYVSAENKKIIELLQQQNQNLIKENTSKNTIIKALRIIKLLNSITITFHSKIQISTKRQQRTKEEVK